MLEEPIDRKVMFRTLRIWEAKIVKEKRNLTMRSIWGLLAQLLASLQFSSCGPSNTLLQVQTETTFQNMDRKDGYSVINLIVTLLTRQNLGSVRHPIRSVFVALLVSPCEYRGLETTFRWWTYQCWLSAELGYSSHYNLGKNH